MGTHVRQQFYKRPPREKRSQGHLADRCCKQTVKTPAKEIAALATIITAAISYLTLLEENCSTFNGLKLQEESGWKELEDGINILVDLWLEKQ